MRGVVAVALLLLDTPQAAPTVPERPALGLPSELAKYHAWTRLLKEAHPVSWQLWIKCMAPTQADWAAAREKTGPHTERFIMVYGNPAAAAAFSAEGKPFPLGAAIAKEKFHLESKGSPDGVAFMVKRSAAEFRDTGGWEFLYYPAAGDRLATHKQCASCHRGASRDFVFGPYPRPGGWTPQNSGLQPSRPAEATEPRR